MTSPTPETLLAAFASTLPWPLDDFQREAILALENASGVLVSAPTSSGKTIIAEYAIWRSLGAPLSLRPEAHEPSRVIYTTPIKALSNQKYRDLCHQYGEERVGLVTGEHTVNDDAAVVVMTTEILRNVIYDDAARLDSVHDIILDEIHYIDDYPRGTVWEEVICNAPPHIRMIGLSATISNAEEIATWMSSLRGSIPTVTKTERPVPLTLWLALEDRLYPLFDTGGNVDRSTLQRAQNDDMQQPYERYVRRGPSNDLLAIVDDLRRRSLLPAIYFIFSRRQCSEALLRCTHHSIDLTSRDEKRQIDAMCEERLARITDPDERMVYEHEMSRASMRRGIAMHHAGMLPYTKELVEELFTHGLIKVVFATETLSLGLNMPAKACVVSSFTKFDGTGFASLTSGELAQLMGRAGRRGIDPIGHGVILKEADVDIHDIYDAAIGTPQPVVSKFAPTYTMALNLLRIYSPDAAVALLERSFGQHQNIHQAAHWVHRRRNLESRLADLSSRTFRHPRIPCTTKTLTSHLHAEEVVTEATTELSRVRSKHWRDRKRGRYGGKSADPGQKYEALKRSLKTMQLRVAQSPCTHCPLFNEHRSSHHEIIDIRSLLSKGEQEYRTIAQRYRQQFTAFRTVLTTMGFLDDDKPTPMGSIAGALFGDNALLVAEAVTTQRLDHLSPPELSAALAMLVAEDRGPNRAAARPRFPTPHVENAWRHFRSAHRTLATLEQQHGLDTVRPLSVDYVFAVYDWTTGVPLADIELPTGVDLGDAVKVVKNVYALLRQMEQALHGLPLLSLVAATRKAVERDLIRRI